jgi:putative ABC transport system permease protein
MIKNFFIIAWRSLLKDGRFSLLNLAGLSVGLACTLLIYLWVRDERAMDRFLAHGDRLYQVMQNGAQDEGGVMTMEATPEVLAPALKAAFPEVQDAAVIHFPDEDESPKGILSVQGAAIKARELFVTKNFFAIFSFRLVAGQPGNRSGVLLSEAMAMRLFHTLDGAIGKTVTWDRGPGEAGLYNGVYAVTGIFANPPAQSSMQFDMLFDYALYGSKITHDVGWLSSNPSTYLLLKEEANPAQLNAKLKNFIRSKFKPGTDEYKWAGTLFLQRYTDKYLYNHYENGAVSGGRIAYVRLFSLIALFVLGIACINFMTLSTAKAAGRVREVGIKKVVGATRGILIGQYLTESLLMALLSLGVACLLCWLCLPVFNDITGKHMYLHADGGTMAAFIGITLAAGLLAGVYPAFYLSGFRAASALRGRLSGAGAAARVRKGLVVLQFSLSVMLIVTVVVVYRQMRLIGTINLGYTKDHVVRIAGEGGVGRSQQAFLAEARGLPGVLGASDMEGDLIGNHSGGGGIDWPGKKQRIEFSGLYVDYGFMELMGLQLKAGHFFSAVYGTDSNGVVFNETAIAMMGLKDPVGKTVSLWGRKETIIGVVRDFHYESLYKRVGPLFLSFRANVSTILVRLQRGRERETLAGLSGLYQRFNPGLPFEYSFLDADYQALYASEERVAVLSRYFAGIAILISCLGLFGLAAFTAQKRQKEIGIRKVVGASVRQLMLLLSWEFLRLVLLAVVIAVPLSWWITDRWLAGFAYRAGLSAGVFVSAGLMMLLIALFTVGIQTLRAAVANPIKALRSE